MLAFVLERRPLNDADEIITFCTEERGRAEALGRGIKKITNKNASFLEPIFLLDIDLVPGGDRFRLIRAFPVQSFSKILSSPTALALLGFTQAILRSVLQDGVPDRHIFLEIIRWYGFLSARPTTSPFVRYAFLLKLWDHLGFRPQIDACASCGSQSARQFEPSLGGLVCAACRSKNSALQPTPLTSADMHLLRVLLDGPYQSAQDLLATTSGNLAVFRAVDGFIAYYPGQAVPAYYDFFTTLTKEHQTLAIRP